MATKRTRRTSKDLAGYLEDKGKKAKRGGQAVTGQRTPATNRQRGSVKVNAGMKSSGKTRSRGVAGTANRRHAGRVRTAPARAKARARRSSTKRK